MSGIFGFTCPTATEYQQILDGMSYWTRIYGKEGSGAALYGCSGIGCHVEHFSDKFPHGGPVLELDGCPAVVDALIFNRNELLEELHPDRGSLISDEELLLLLIKVKGFEALARVNGDFAGAIFDPERQEWTLFRDHLGVRPLFYCAQPDLFAFSTDIRSILSIPELEARPNGDKVFKEMTGFMRMAELETGYENICCLRPGSVTRFRRTERGFTQDQRVYWRLRQKKIRFKTDAEYASELCRLVTDAVNRRCDAIPGVLGAELSGGLDSSVIDILVNRHGREAVYYSWSVDPELFPIVGDHDERNVIRDICEQENITCRFLRGEDQFNRGYMIAQVMPPYATAAHLAFGSKWMADQGARVVFSGHGGDEGVSHRASWLELLYNREFLAYFRLHWNETRGRSLRILRTGYHGLRYAIQKWNSVKCVPSGEIPFADCLDPQFLADEKAQLRPDRLPFCYDPVSYIDRGGTRVRLDNAAFFGSFSGVRYLFPYVDYRVMDFAVSVPRRLHVNNETSRVLFRNAFAHLMPQSLREVNYKDIPSGRDVDRIAAANKTAEKSLKFVLSALDPDYWSGILDADGIRAALEKNISTNEEYVCRSRLNSALANCITVQNVAKESKRWRERNE